MYQYYKINAVGLKAIPQPIEGSYPPTAWAYLQGNDDMTIAYASIPRLPGSKIIPNNKVTTRYFKRRGLQQDFNFYQNTTNYVENSDFSIKLRFASGPNQAVFIFQVTVFLQFSMLVEQASSKQPEIEEKARTQPTMPIINPEVIKQLNESVTSFNMTTSNLDISQVSEVKSEPQPKIEEEPKYPMYKYRKTTHGIKKMVKLQPGGRWQYAEQAKEIVKTNKEDDLFAGIEEDLKQFREEQKQQKTKPVVKREEPPIYLEQKLPTGERVKTTKPLTTGQVNQILSTQADKMIDKGRALLVRIANKPLEKQADIIQNYLKTCEDPGDKILLEGKLKEIQKVLVEELLQ
jgi:hypothetical protein